MQEEPYKLARLRKHIPEQARDPVPKHSGNQAITSLYRKTNAQLSRPGLILTWLLDIPVAPTAAFGLLVRMQVGFALPVAGEKMP